MSLTPRRTKRPATPICCSRKDLGPICFGHQTRLGSDRAHRLQRLLRVQQSLEVVPSRFWLTTGLALDREKGEGPPERRRPGLDIIFEVRRDHALKVPFTHAVDPVQRLHRISVEYERLDDRRDQ